MWNLLKGLFLGLYVGARVNSAKGKQLPYTWITIMILILACIGLLTLLWNHLT